jgi:hypothetical protein
MISSVMYPGAPISAVVTWICLLGGLVEDDELYDEINDLIDLIRWAMEGGDSSPRKMFLNEDIKS